MKRSLDKYHNKLKKIPARFRDEYCKLNADSISTVVSENGNRARYVCTRCGRATFACDGHRSPCKKRKKKRQISNYQLGELMIGKTKAKKKAAITRKAHEKKTQQGEDKAEGTAVAL